MSTCGIYMIINLATGDCYVGRSKRIETRWSQHRRDLKSGMHVCHKLQEAWTTYGADAFEFTVLEEVDISTDSHALQSAESRCIHEIQPEYNIMGVGEAVEAATSQSQPFDVLVTIFNDVERTQGWDALWQRLLRPLPDEQKAKQDAGESEPAS